MDQGGLVNGIPAANITMHRDFERIKKKVKIGVDDGQNVTLE